MTGSLAPYDLADDFCCGECGRPKLGRLFARSLTGCEECDEVITRHRCGTRPRSDMLPPGLPWTCRVCGSVWVVRSVTQPCGECGQPVTSRCWDVTEDRRRDGPRHEPEGFTPFRNLLLSGIRDAMEAEARGRQEWIAGVAERLGLVVTTDGGEDHRGI